MLLVVKEETDVIVCNVNDLEIQEAAVEAQGKGVFRDSSGGGGKL